MSCFSSKCGIISSPLSLVCQNTLNVIHRRNSAVNSTWLKLHCLQSACSIFSLSLGCLKSTECRPLSCAHRDHYNKVSFELFGWSSFSLWPWTTVFVVKCIYLPVPSWQTVNWMWINWFSIFCSRTWPWSFRRLTFPMSWNQFHKSHPYTDISWDSNSVGCTSLYLHGFNCSFSSISCHKLWFASFLHMFSTSL